MLECLLKTGFLLSVQIKYDNAGYTIKPFPPAKVHKYVIGDSLGTYLLARLIVCFIRMDRSDLIPVSDNIF